MYILIVTVVNKTNDRFDELLFVEPLKSKFKYSFSKIVLSTHHVEPAH